MKTFKNKNTIIKDENNKVLTYAELGIVVARTPSNNGMAYDEMAKRIRIVDALEKSKGKDSIKMEDADFNLFKALAKNHIWRTGADKSIVMFTEDVLAVK